jgi:phospholipid transport system substrate-binding protein
MPLVARLVLGKYWRQANAQQQQAYVQLFEQLVIKTMATQLSNYGGETFEIVASRDAGERDTVVSTRILRPSGAAPFNVDWRVREDSGRFLIVDIVAEGISMVVSQRSEVTEIVSQRGIDGLIAAMRERLESPA